MLRFRCIQFSASGIVPGSDGEWKSVCDDSDMCITAGMEAVRSAFLNILPITHACSHVKCAKVKLFSSCARSARFRVGGGMVSSILDDDDDRRGIDYDCDCDGRRGDM